MIVLELIYVSLDVFQDAGQAPATVSYCRQSRVRHLPRGSGQVDRKAVKAQVVGAKLVVPPTVDRAMCMHVCV